MIECFLQGQLRHAHEREAILKLAQLMQRAFAASDRTYILAANVHIWRQQIDALVLAPHAVTLIELKSCADPVCGRSAGPWHVLAGGERIRGGSFENPYQQVVVAREKLIKYLDRNRRRFLTGARVQAMAKRWGHVSAALVFSPYLHPDSDIVVSPESRAWLGIIGMNEVVEFLFSRSSPQIDLRPQELRRLAVEALHCEPWVDLEALLPSAPGSGHLWLLDEEGHRTYAFPLIAEGSIGRSRDNALVVPARFVRTSRHHAVFRVVGDTAWLYDSESTHGTFVNGEVVPPDQGQPLRDGDLVVLGSVEHPGACALRFEHHARTEADTHSTSATRT